jgi:hypothetical protein
MAYTYHGTSNLIALPNRTVQTYPSGLVRVERSYVCRKADAGRNRSKFEVGDFLPDDDGAPAIDGLYIFPAAQETVRDDGFVEFKVSAYGRINTIGSQRQEFIRSSTLEVNFSFSQITIENCLPNSTALTDLLKSPPVDLVFAIEPQDDVTVVRTIPIPKLSVVALFKDGNTTYIIGPTYVFENGGFIIERQSSTRSLYQALYYYTSSAPVILSNSSRNFGFFTEFTVTYGWSRQPIYGVSTATQFKINDIPV